MRVDISNMRVYPLGFYDLVYITLPLKRWYEKMSGKDVYTLTKDGFELNIKVVKNND